MKQYILYLNMYKVFFYKVVSSIKLVAELCLDAELYAADDVSTAYNSVSSIKFVAFFLPLVILDGPCLPLAILEATCMP